MAGVEAAGLTSQLRLMAWLRWRIFRNSLSKKGAALDLIALILAGVMGGLLAVGAGIGLGITSYFMVSQGRFTFLSLVFWAVFALWQLMPVMVATAGSGFDFRNLLRFPLRFSTFYLLGLALGFADPAALAGLFWLLCITAGITLANAHLFLPCVLLVLTFAALNLLLNRMIFSWLERLLARRRSREALLALFLLCIFAVQFSGPFFERYGRQVKPVLEKFLPLLSFLPGGLPASGLEGIARGEALPLLSSAALLLGYAAAFGLLFGLRLRAQYHGEELSETPAAAAPTKKFARRPARAVPGAVVSSPGAVARRSILSSLIPAAAAAVLSKELRYLLRNSVMLLNLAMPAILIALVAFSAGSPRRHNPFFTRMPDLAFPAALAYMFLIFSQFGNNAFAYESRGIQTYYLVPVPFRDILLGKNLMLALELAFEAVVVWLLISFMTRPPGAIYLLGSLAWMLFAMFIHFVAGNWLSLQFPRRLEIGQFRGRASGMTVLIGLGLQIAVVGLGVLVGLFTLWAGRLWIFPLVFLILAACAFWVYTASLDRFSAFALDRREDLFEKLVRQRV